MKAAAITTEKDGRAIQSRVEPGRVDRIYEYLLDQQEGKTPQEITKALGLSYVNYARKDLSKMMTEGRIIRKRNEKQRIGKPGYVYFANALGIPAIIGEPATTKIPEKLPCVGDFIKSAKGKVGPLPLETLHASLPAAGILLQQMSERKQYSAVAQLGRIIADLGEFLDKHAENPLLRRIP